MVSAALKSTEEIFSGLNLFPSIIYPDNFTRAWNEAHIVLVCYRFRGKRIVIGFFAAAIFLPEGYTIIPIFNLLHTLHLSTSLWGIILAESGGAHIVMVLLFASFFSQLPKDLEEAATVDGAGVPAGQAWRRRPRSRWCP